MRLRLFPFLARPRPPVDLEHVARVAYEATRPMNLMESGKHPEWDSPKFHETNRRRFRAIARAVVEELRR